MESLSLEKQLAQAFYVTRRKLLSHQTRRKSLSLNSSQDTRETTLLNTSWQLQCSTTGAITNTQNPHFLYRLGPSCLLSHVLLSVHGRNAKSLCIFPKSTTPKKQFRRKQLQHRNEIFKTWEELYFYTTAPRHTPFPKCLGSTSVFTSMTESSPKCGRTSSQEPNLSKNGE
jgi:hypothetical protein